MYRANSYSIFSDVYIALRLGVLKLSATPKFIYMICMLLASLPSVVYDFASRSINYLEWHWNFVTAANVCLEQ